MMKAVLFRAHGGPDKLSYEDLPTPTIGPEDVLVRVKACALNHLDMWIREGNPAYPMPLPHVLGSDAAGIVEQVGAQVDSVTAGQRVFVSPGISCWKCEQCLAGRDNMCRSYGLLGAMTHGSYAEYVKVPFRNVLPIIRHHHEKQDGSGYPDGLKGAQVPLTARILQITDIYDALTTDRPYRKALPSEKAFAILREEVKRGWWDGSILDEFEAAVYGYKPVQPARSGS